MQDDDEGFSGTTQLSTGSSSISCVQNDKFHGRGLEINSSSTSIEKQVDTNTPLLLSSLVHSIEKKKESQSEKKFQTILTQALIAFAMCLLAFNNR